MSIISVDVRLLHASGIGTYIKNLVPRVIDALPNTQFFLLGHPPSIVESMGPTGRNVATVALNAPVYSASEQFELLRKIPSNTSLTWCPHYNIPMFYRGELLVTIHDVFHLAMPRHVGGFHKALYARALFAAVRRKANAIIADSEFSRRELVRLTGPGKQDIHTAHIGVDPSWFSGIAQQPSLHPKPYLLFVGNVKPHKNLSGLLKAFASLIGKLPHDLIIVGKREGFRSGDEKAVAKAKKLADRVHFTGHINDQSLRKYFAHADALILPSLYEGFGLPPLEAMACGCPVIVSDVAALPEVCGDAALYCDPYNPADIADKIQRLMGDDELRTTLRARGLERAQQFSWDTCARKTLEVIEKLLHAN